MSVAGIPILAPPLDDAIFVQSLVNMLCVALTCYFLQEASGNYSWVDCLWSIIPSLWGWVYYNTSAHTSNDWVASAMLFLVVVWGCRLTYNFMRRGGYNPGEEDYRWYYARQMIPQGVLWQLFSLGFVAVKQNFVLQALTYPILVVSKSAEGVPTIRLVLTWVCVALAYISLAVEITADQQQWHFQQRKAAKVTKKRFITTGLFRYSRHPNFVAEQSIWWFSYAAASFYSGNFIGYHMIGPFLLSMVFHMSTDLTEKISLSKYPEYVDYQEVVPRLLPQLTPADC